MTDAGTGASLLFPRSVVHCVEPDPALQQAMRFFDTANYRPQTNQNFFPSFASPLSGLVKSDPSWDVVLVDAVDLRLPETARFLTTQFLSQAKSTLSENGILAERLTPPSFTPAEIAALCRTVQSIFPHCALARISPSQYVLLASAAPLVQNTDAVKAAQSLVAQNSAPSTEVTV